ncbi:UBX domain protein Ubx2 [Lecanora helva]
MDADTIAQFAGITGSSDHTAAQYLRLAEGNTEAAIELFYANEGADLETTSSQSHHPEATRTAVPPISTRPISDRHGYEDDEGVVHIDSDQDDHEDTDGDGDVEITSETQRRAPMAGEPSSLPGDTSHTRPSAGALDDDEAMARRLQEEFYGAAGRSSSNGNLNSEVVDEYRYRAPLGRTTETLVGPGSFDPSNAEEMRAAVSQQMMARRQHPRHRERHGVFNQAPAPSIWHDEEGRPTGHQDQSFAAPGGASGASSKANLLAEMYRPPFELISRLSWDQARQHGRDGEKWILVNIQDSSIFDCQILNRDLWKNPGIIETVRENFIFMQYSKDDPKANQYIQYYFQDKESPDAYPHIAIVDPRTGEKVKVWSGPPVPKAMDFLMQLHEFLDRYSLKATAKNPVARRKPEAKPETQVATMTEEQMMEMALQASLSGREEGKRAHDPDDLTRSVGSIGGRKGKAKETEGSPGIGGVSEVPVDTNGSLAPTASLFDSITGSSPHSEPTAGAENVTRIQFRHPNGRVVRRFSLTDPVRRIFEWLKASPLEGKQGVEFELIFMGKNLIEVLDDTIEQAGLKNGTVMVELIEN